MTNEEKRELKMIAVIVIILVSLILLLTSCSTTSRAGADLRYAKQPESGSVFNVKD